jgi:hypothetical protein
VNHAVIVIVDFSGCCAPGAGMSKRGLQEASIRLEIPDQRECATAPLQGAGAAKLCRVRKRAASQNGGFCDQQCGISTYPAMPPTAGKNRARIAPGNPDASAYFTIFSGVPRRWPFRSDRPSAKAATGSIASHNAFNSESAIRLSFIRRSRIATDNIWAVSGLELTKRAARLFSSIMRIERNRSSELATSVFSDTELAM